MIFVKSLLVIFLLNFFSSFAFKTPNHIKILERSPTACKLVQTIDTSYNLAIGLGLTTFASCIYDQLKAKSINKWGVSASTLVLTFILGYVTVKTSSVKFSFDDTSFSLVKSDGSSLGQHPLWPSLGERGDYRWKYKRILNFSLLPNADLPLFLYLKETETPDVDIIQAPFSLDKLNGQVHIFPVICNHNQLQSELEKVNIKKIDTSDFSLQQNPVLFIKGLQLI